MLTLRLWLLDSVRDLLQRRHPPVAQFGLVVCLACNVAMAQGEFGFGMQPSPASFQSPGLPTPLSATPADASMTSAAPAELGAQQTVADVRIVGNDSISTDRIYSLIRTRKGRNLDPELLQQDKRNLMTKGLFRDVRIATQQTAHGVLVTFEVFERPTIHFIYLLGDRGIGEKTLLKEAGLKIDDALNFYSVEEGRRKIEDLYHRKGYPKARVTIEKGNRPEDRGVVFRIEEGPLQRIQGVMFTGNSDIASDSRLKTQIESKRGYLGYFFGGKLDHDKVAADKEKLLLYYRNLGFFRARVGCELQSNSDNEWVTINFVIDEGPRYVVRNVSVIGNDKFSSEQLLEAIQLKAGQYFKQDAMLADKAELYDMYAGNGYIFADINASPRFHEEPGELDLVYEIAEGEQFRVGRINVKIAGEFPHTKERVILDRLSIKSGDIVDIRKIRESERRLKLSQLFVVNPAEGNPPQIVIVPPDLKDVKEVLANDGGKRTYRGQTPTSTVPEVNLEVILPR